MGQGLPGLSSASLGEGHRTCVEIFYSQHQRPHPRRGSPAGDSVAHRCFGEPGVEDSRASAYRRSRSAPRREPSPESSPRVHALVWADMSEPCLSEDSIYVGDARRLLEMVKPESVALSFWSPPYFVGKSYERDLTFDDWQDLLSSVIKRHFAAIAPGGFLVINIADIIAFPDPEMTRIQ